MNRVALQAPPAGGSDAARAAAWLYASLVAAVLGLFLLELPIQVSDSYGNMLKLASSWRDLMIGEFTQRAYLRPLLWAKLKLVYELADGNYFAWFRGVHVVHAATVVALFVALVRPRRWVDVAVLPLGLAILIGSHTFLGTVNEAFPINTFMTVLICCFTVAVLALAEYRWWHDPAAVLLFVVAALTVESGLLVGVIVVGAALVGARGVSRPAAAMVALLFAGYFVLRFSVLNVGAPQLLERASGFGFTVLEPAQLAERFGGNPLGFYAYNVASSALSVLFAEPRAGIWRLTQGLVAGNPSRALMVNVVATTLVTGCIAWYAWRRRQAWRSWAFDRDDRLVLLFLMVLAANAVISYPYTKDSIMSPAGAFYALAGFVAVKHLLASVDGTSLRRTVAIAACCLVLGVTWGLRHVATHANLRSAAFRVRNDWVFAERWARGQGLDIEAPHAAALMSTLKADAIFRHPAPPAFPIRSQLLDVE